MQAHQTQLIELCLKREALRFGEFTLKSGRQSPYFLNFGRFCTGADMNLLGDAYAKTILAHDLEFDVLFGPAYKGIPIVTATAMALNTLTGHDAALAYNRKEKKDHGEGGQLVGADVTNQRVLILDDLMTAGTAVRESITMLQQANAHIAGIVLAVDRQERGQSQQAATQELAAQYQIPVITIINLDHIISFMQSASELQSFTGSMLAYQQQYGSTHAD